MPTPKKAAAKHAPDQAIKDERRGYEHHGRVQALHKYLDKGAAKDVTKLTELAKQELEAGHMKEAADLFRAAEHLSFGSIHGPKKEEAHPKLKAELTHEFEGKLKKADEHWSEEEQHPAGLEEIYSSAKERAQKAFDDGFYRAALELARGAEALAHVKTHDKEESSKDEADETKTEE